MLPAVGFFIVFVASTLTYPRLRVSGRCGLLTGIVFFVLMLWYSVGTLLSYPHYISYFNELAGGPRQPHRGHEILADSNLDWGQDWIRLAKWQEKEDIRELKLAYFGLVDPAIYGVRYRPARCQVTTGYVAVSTNIVLGVDPFRPNNRCFTKLRHAIPVARPGPSIWVYRFP